MSPRERSRRTVLQALAAAVPAVLGGCTEAIEGTTQTDEPVPCEAASSPTPEDDYPEPPPELTERTAREYALAYERAYQRARQSGYASLTVDTGPEITTTSDGFVVQFVAWLRTRDGGVGTATAVPSDRFYAVQYAVTDVGAWRVARDSAGPLETAPTPMADGYAVACF